MRGRTNEGDRNGIWERGEGDKCIKIYVINKGRHHWLLKGNSTNIIQGIGGQIHPIGLWNIMSCEFINSIANLYELKFVQDAMDV